MLPFRDHPVDALIIDLRGNAGGLLTAAVSTCDYFIDDGMIVSTRGRDGQVEDEYHASADNTIFPRSTPVVVLADRYSASASEIVAACLKDHKRAVVIGERTWGKGTVQNVIPLEHGTSALKLTTASYWRPSGKNIHRRKKATEQDDWGVRPTAGLKVPLTDDQCRQLYEQLRDREVLHGVDAAQEPPTDPESSGDEDNKGEFEDIQLQKAIDYLSTAPAPKAS